MTSSVPIQITMDTSDLLRKKEGVIRSLEDIRNKAAEARIELSKIGLANNSVDKLETSLKEADNALEELGADATISFDKVQQGADESADRVDKFGKRLNDSSNRARTSLISLKNAVIAVATGTAINAIVSLSDSYTQLNNTIRLVTDSQNEANQVIEELSGIANSTYQPVNQIAELYQKVKSVSGELGASQEDIVGFITSVSSGLALQGGNAQSAAGALLQLSQAIGGTNIQAEEYNSILDGAFPVAQAAAKGIDAAGGSVAKLTALVKVGKVSSKEFFDAILSQSDDLAGKLAILNPTISQAATVFSNELTLQMEKSEGVFGAVAELILLVALNLDSLISTATAFGVAFAVAFAPKVIVGALTAARNAMVLLNVTMAANPIGAIAFAITGLITLLYQFSDEISVTSDGVVSLGDVFSVVFNLIMSVISPVITFFRDTWSAAFSETEEGANTWSGSMSNIMGGFLVLIKDIINSFIGLFVGAYQSIIKGWKLFPSAMKDIVIGAYNAIVTVVEEMVNFVLEKLSTLTDLANEASNFLGFGDIFDAFEATNLSKYKGELSGAASELGSIVKEEFDKALGTDYLGNAGKSIIDKARKKAEARDSSSGDSGSSTGSSQGLSDSIQAARDKVANSNSASSSAKDKIKKSGGSKDAANDNVIKSHVMDLTKEFGPEVEASFTDAIDGIERHLINFVKTGKINFEDLSGSLLESFQPVIDSLVKDLVNSLSSSSGSSSGGGGGLSDLFGSLGGLFGGGSSGGASESSGTISSSSSGGGGGSLGSTSSFGFDQGVNYVPRDMVAKLHRGEKVVSAADNKNSSSNLGSNPINITINGVTDFSSFKKNQGQLNASIGSSISRAQRRNA